MTSNFEGYVCLKQSLCIGSCKCLFYLIPYNYIVEILVSIVENSFKINKSLILCAQLLIK